MILATTICDFADFLESSLFNLGVMVLPVVGTEGYYC